MIETVMVLVVFFFLLAGGLVIYRSFSQRGDVRRSQEYLELRALRLAQVAASLPELQCSSDNIIEDNCVDVIKAKAMSEMIATNPTASLFYYDTFMAANISVKEAYPGDESFVIYSYKPENSTLSEVIILPITIYDPAAGRGMCLSLTGACNFGVIKVVAYR